MEAKLLHTPEGVRDIYNSECKRKLYLQDELHEIFKQYGFHDIQTPTFEYFDVFSKEVGTIPSKDLYKFFDREGNTLVLRPDYTPSIARCTAKYYMEEEMPLRFCYAGNVFINETAAYQGRLKETTQMGAEMIGDTTAQADSEMASLVINLLLQSGLENFQLEIGEVDFFNGLLEEAKFDAKTIQTMRELISNKNYFGLEELLSNQPISKELKTVFMKIPELFGSIDILEQAKQLTSNSRALAAIDRLYEIYEILKLYRLEKYVSFDLGMLSKYHYYTGIIFQAFTLGTGEAIVKGGRYDHLLGLFGKNAPSIGFSLMLDQLMLALSRQNIRIPVGNGSSLFVYQKQAQASAIVYATICRKQGENIELICMDETKKESDYIEYAKRNDMKKVVFFDNPQQVREITVASEHTQSLDITSKISQFT